MVSGTEIYNVLITIKKLPPEKWRRVKTRCEGQIGSLLELLQGRLSQTIMAVVTDRDNGLFPQPREIKLKCDCPDWAVMCKHVAAVLYGVGARLDESPELLFLLRGVDHQELIGSEAEMVAAATAGKESGRRRIAESELERVFGIEIGGEGPAASAAAAPEKLGPSGARPSRRGKAASGRKKTQSSGSKNRVRAKPKVSASVFPGASPGTTGIQTVTGAKVRKLRRKLSLSQAEFAARLGVSVVTVGNWERRKGRLNLQARTRKALSNAASPGNQKAPKRTTGKKTRSSGRK